MGRIKHFSSIFSCPWIFGWYLLILQFSVLVWVGCHDWFNFSITWLDIFHPVSVNFWTMTLTFILDQHKVEANHHAVYSSHFIWKLSNAHTLTQTLSADCFILATKLMVKTGKWKANSCRWFVLLKICCCKCLIRSLSPELQEDVLRIVANGNLLLKTSKPFMPGIAGLGPRSGLSQQQIAGLPAGLNSQVTCCSREVFCNTSYTCSYL